ncbi:uncharacterized protein VTP21DRAFT_6811 [Calcarisporiella thermophila]|uniref:uncharacterized protein n=1 Tax=Calcarisporiella thermophila TaxID=911321 RepID=UPI0037442F0F
MSQSLIESPLPPSSQSASSPKPAQPKKSRRLLTQLLDKLLVSLEDSAPFNITPITDTFLRQALIDRLAVYEHFLNRRYIYRLFIRCGVPPSLLFLVVAGSAGWGWTWMYRKRYKELAVGVGVLWPLLGSLRALKESDYIPEEEDSGKENDAKKRKEEAKRRKEMRRWLCYWIMYGVLQLFDTCAHRIHSLFPAYPIYKLVALFWLQNDVSKGSLLLLDYVLAPMLRNRRKWRRRREALEDDSSHDEEDNLSGEHSKHERAAAAMKSYRPELSAERIWRQDKPSSDVQSSREESSRRVDGEGAEARAHKPSSPESSLDLVRSSGEGDESEDTDDPRDPYSPAPRDHDRGFSRYSRHDELDFATRFNVQPFELKLEEEF